MYILQYYLKYFINSLSLQATLASWQEFDNQQAAVGEFVSKARSITERDMTFSSPESLTTELKQAQVNFHLKWLLENTFLSFYTYVFSYTYCFILNVSYWLFQELLKQSENEAKLVSTLLKRAEEIQLGPKNASLLHTQAHSLSDQLDKTVAGLKKE